MRARYHCQRLGGRLAITNDNATIARLGYILQNINDVAFWPIYVGASAVEDRRWMWVDNTFVSTNVWTGTQSIENTCGVLEKMVYSNSTWKSMVWHLNQRACTIVLSFQIGSVCEKPACKCSAFMYR